MKVQSAIKTLTEAKEVLTGMRVESYVDERIAALGVAIVVVDEAIRALADPERMALADEDGGVR